MFYSNLTKRTFYGASSRTLFFLSVFVSTGIYWWRAQFGVDLTDEAFYLLPAWKLIPSGDQFFVDEIFNGVRHNDLLNSLFIAPWTDFNVLELRRLAVLFYSACLCFFFLVSFGQRLGVVAAMLFPALLTYDYFLTPTWSYNWWARNALLVHHGLLILAVRTNGQVYRRIGAFVSGLGLGVAVVAYNSLLPLLLLSILLFMVLNRYWLPVENRRLNVGWYAAGVLLPIAADIVFILVSGLATSWLISVKTMSSMSEYGSSSAFTKLLGLIQYVFFLKEFWFSLVLSFLVICKVRMGKTTSAFTVVASILFFYFKSKDFSKTHSLVASVNGLTFGSVPLLLWLSYRGKSSVQMTLTLVALVGIVGIGVSSTNHYLAFFWLAPLLIVPFSAAFMHLFGLMNAPRFALGGFIALIGLSVFQYQRLNTYYDVPPGNCTTLVETPPLTGLKTSQRRAEIIKMLDSMTRGHTYVLAFGDIPGTLFFNESRAAVDTTIVEVEGASRQVNQRSIENMVVRDRIPTLIIKAKIHPWYWGIHHPFAEKPMSYPKNDPYSAFADCVRGRTVAKQLEFEAYSVDRAKISKCVKLASNPEIAMAETPKSGY